MSRSSSFGYLAAITSLDLVTGVIILPQRQSVLAAKQAAEVDLLTAPRSRLSSCASCGPNRRSPSTASTTQ
jgi:alkanesulfonate monooxygenase SsuD/methylene tetrahydromethanopterin reductase-like flavin-dependent oxidoreductase (luciferase family)